MPRKPPRLTVTEAKTIPGFNAHLDAHPSTGKNYRGKKGRILVSWDIVGPLLWKQRAAQPVHVEPNTLRAPEGAMADDTFMTVWRQVARIWRYSKWDGIDQGKKWRAVQAMLDGLEPIEAKRDGSEASKMTAHLLDDTDL